MSVSPNPEPTTAQRGVPHLVPWFLFFDKEDSVLALPSWAAPRILMVSRSRRQRWCDSSAFYPAFRFRARLVKWVVRIAAAFFPRLFLQQSRTHSGGTAYGLAPFLNRVFPSFKQSALASSLFSDYFMATGILSADEYVDSEDRRGRLIGVLRSWFPQTDRVVLMAGAASDPKQKFVAKLVDHSGRMAGFVKFGEKPLARQRIETEAEILQSLPAGCGPRFKRMEKTGDYFCFAMSAVDGKMPEAKLSASVDSHQLWVVREYLERLRVSDVTFGVDNHPAIVRLREQLPASDIPLSTFNNWLSPLRGKAWPLVIQHGDFAPWNLLHRSEDGGQKSAVGHLITPPRGLPLVALDWEEGTTSGFPHFDLIYYVLQTAYFMHHWSSTKAVAYAREVLRSQWSVDGGFSTPSNQFAAAEQADSLIRLAALDAWLTGERGGLSGNPLQKFRLSILRLQPEP